MYVLVVGQEYPLEIGDDTGAIIDAFASNENTLAVTMPGIQESEFETIMHGKLTCGMLCKNSAIHLIWKFQAKNLPLPMIFETPYDIRRYEEKNFIDFVHPETRLFFTIHLVDSESKKLCGIRGTTMGPELSLAFLAAAQDQLVSPFDPSGQTDFWMSCDLEALMESTTMWEMGL